MKPTSLLVLFTTLLASATAAAVPDAAPVFELDTRDAENDLNVLSKRACPSNNPISW